LVSSLTRQSELNVVGAGCSGDAFSQIPVSRPEVLLLDLAARDSLTIPRRAQQILPTLRVVAFAVAEVEENVLACAEAGISGYVAQDGSVEDLVTAVLHALSGELVCSPRIAALLFRRMATLSNGRAAASADAPLTPREREIAALIACNLRNKEIARRLRLGPTTVKNHVHNILQKLNIHRRGDIARLRFEGNPWRDDLAARTIERPQRSA
jgi:DNA-binding NarL/FixJ family response regulator